MSLSFRKASSQNLDNTEDGNPDGATTKVFLSLRAILDYLKIVMKCWILIVYHTNKTQGMLLNVTGITVAKYP